MKQLGLTKNLSTIADLFIRPLLRFCPETMATHEYLSVIFGVDVRHIDYYTALRGFTLPGEFLAHQAVPVPGIISPSRNIEPGEKVLVRSDTRTPNMFDVEVFTPTNDVYRLNQEEWNRILSHIRADRKAAS